MKKKEAPRREKPVQGSEEAKRRASVLMEVWSGLLGTGEAQKALGISTMTYYRLERQALEGMVRSLEPQGKGPRRKVPESREEELKAEASRLERELRRQQSLFRLARRAYGLKEPAAPEGKKRRRRTRKVLLKLKGEPGK